MIPDKATRDAWRAEFHAPGTMHSAVDEYCPREFLELLDAVDELEKRPPATGFCIGSTVWPGLSKLAEEAGEVLQIVGKLIATGGKAEHWDGQNLRERLTEEVADLIAACEFVYIVNGLDRERIKARIGVKFRQFLKWHTEQKS